MPGQVAMTGAERPRAGRLGCACMQSRQSWRVEAGAHHAASMTALIRLTAVRCMHNLCLLRIRLWSSEFGAVVAAHRAAGPFLLVGTRAVGSLRRCRSRAASLVSVGLCRTRSVQATRPLCW